MLFCRTGIPRLCILVTLAALPSAGFASEAANAGTDVEVARSEPAVNVGPPARGEASVAQASAQQPLAPPEGQGLPGPVLRLDQALQLALAGNPSLAALDYETQAADARQYQGSLKPNPELQAEVSQFLGTAEMRFFGSAITGVGLSQLVERGQKRCARMAVAEREGNLIEFEKARSRLDILLRVSRAYYSVLIAQERLRLAQGREQLAQQVCAVVSLKVEAGKSARLELSRVKLDLANTKIGREQAQAAFDSARRFLAAQWGAKAADFGSVEGELALPSEAPDIQQFESLLADTPDIQRWQAEECLRQAKRDLAFAEGVPDLTVSGGIERFEDTDSFGLRVGVSVPLPIHNRNEGNISAAQAYLQQAKSLRQADLLKAQQDLAATCADLTADFSRATQLQKEVLPAAQETFDLTNYGYRFGKFGLLEVLDAERTLMDARGQYLDARADYQLAALDLERLIAQPLGPLAATDPPGPAQAPTAPQEATQHDTH